MTKTLIKNIKIKNFVKTKSSVRSLILALLLVLAIISIVQTSNVLNSLGEVSKSLEQKEFSQSGRVRLYVMPTPVSEQGEVRLNVVTIKKNEIKQNG